MFYRILLLYQAALSLHLGICSFLLQTLLDIFYYYYYYYLKSIVKKSHYTFFNFFFHNKKIFYPPTVMLAMCLILPAVSPVFSRNSIYSSLSYFSCFFVLHSSCCSFCSWITKCAIMSLFPSVGCDVQIFMYPYVFCLGLPSQYYKILDIVVA